MVGDTAEAEGWRGRPSPRPSTTGTSSTTRRVGRTDWRWTWLVSAPVAPGGSARSDGHAPSNTAHPPRGRSSAPPAQRSTAPWSRPSRPPSASPHNDPHPWSNDSSTKTVAFTPW